MYRATLSGLIGCVALTLLTILDIRRGFLFDAYATRSAFYVLHALHLPMLAIGVLGVLVCHSRLRCMEDRTTATAHGRVLEYSLGAMLLVDLVAYRAVPASRSLSAGSINVAWLEAFGAVGPWRSVALATSYLLTVWHATMLGILISGLALVAMPPEFRTQLSRRGFAGSLAGALFAVPQPFCSCCSSAMAPSFVRLGASPQFVLAFVLGAPMLNVATVVLALAMLPAPFAAVRIGAGIIVTVCVSYAVARLADPRMMPMTAPWSPWPSWVRRVGGLYTGLLDLESGARHVTRPSQVFAAWLRQSGRVALVLVPTLWIWSCVAALMFQALPPLQNDFAGVGLAAAAGTVFMISTWSEIPIALQFISAGLPGPAAALLVVLPAISLPCMVILAGALQRLNVVVVLALAVMVLGVAVGTLFI
jgi:uncharacterized membrane protein YraQ (UPF0718 family)